MLIKRHRLKNQIEKDIFKTILTLNKTCGFETWELNLYLNNVGAELSSFSCLKIEKITAEFMNKGFFGHTDYRHR